MSDETRTVTVESLAAALRKGEPGTQPINMFADPFDDADADDVAAAIFAALPVATAGPEPGLAWALTKAEHCDLLPRLCATCTADLFAALRGAAAQADGGEPPVAGMWTPDGPVSPDVIDYTKPILERAMAAGRMTATVSGIRWTFTAAARLTDPNP